MIDLSGTPKLLYDGLMFYRPLAQNATCQLSSFPSIALRIPSVHKFTRDEVNRHFLENDSGNLSFFLLL